MLRKINKKTKVIVEHTPTKIAIKRSDVCEECPYRIYADEKDVVKLGIGNIYSNFIFVLPQYDVNASIDDETVLKKLDKFYKKITGKPMLENAYVTRLVKCCNKSNNELYNSAVKPCKYFLQYEIIKLGGKNIVFFGDTYHDYITSSDTVGNNIPNKNIYSCMSAGVLFYDNQDVINAFEKQLLDILNQGG